MTTLILQDSFCEVREIFPKQTKVVINFRKMNITVHNMY